MDTPRVVIGKRYPLRDTEERNSDASGGGIVLRKNGLGKSMDPTVQNLISGGITPKVAEKKRPTEIQPMTREEFIKDMTVLPAQMSAEAKVALQKWGWVFEKSNRMGVNTLLCKVIPPQTRWRKRQTGQPERIQLVDGSGMPRGIIFYRPTGSHPEVSLDIFIDID